MPASLDQSRHAMFPLAMKDWLAIPVEELEALASAASRQSVQRSILSSTRESWATPRELRNRPEALGGPELSSAPPLPSAEPAAGTGTLSEQAFRLHGPAFRTRPSSEHHRVPLRLLEPEEALERLAGMSRNPQRPIVPESAPALHVPATEAPPRAMFSEAPQAAAPAADDSEARVRALLAEALDTCSAHIKTLLASPGRSSLSSDDRRALLAKMIRLYDERYIGKGFSSVVHNLWTILENDEALDVEGLRLCRDTLERLYANPRLTYAEARALRRDLKTGGLPVENRELRQIILDALTSARE